MQQFSPAPTVPQPPYSSPGLETTALQTRKRLSCMRLGGVSSPQVHLNKRRPQRQASVLPFTSDHSISGLQVSKAPLVVVVESGLFRNRKFDFSQIEGLLQNSGGKSQDQRRPPVVSAFDQEEKSDQKSGMLLPDTIPEPRKALEGDFTFHIPPQQLSLSPAVCRICLDIGQSEDLISPCNCKGSQKWVHQECLKQWLVKSDGDVKDLTSCEVCKRPFLMNFYYSLLFAPCENDREKRAVWIPIILSLVLFMGMGTMLGLGAAAGDEGSTVVVVLASLLGFLATLCTLAATCMAKEFWFIRKIEEWEIESVTQS